MQGKGQGNGDQNDHDFFIGHHHPAEMVGGGFDQRGKRNPFGTQQGQVAGFQAAEARGATRIGR